MEFFDDPPSRQRSGGRSGPPPTQSLLPRRLAAIGVALLIFLLLVLGIRGCLSARKDRQFKNYVSDAAELINSSNATGKDFFSLLEKPGNSTPLEIKHRINNFRADADQLAERANSLEPPADLEEANRWLVTSLDFRRDALDQSAQLVSNALSTKNNSAAINQLAGQMQALLASDVLYLQRFTPATAAQLKKRDLSDAVTIPQRRFLTDITWLTPETVANKLDAISGKKATTPGLHGVGLTTVTVEPSGTELSEGQTTTINSSSKLAFAIELQNQGENEETDVEVTLKVGDTELQKTVSRVAAGDTATATIPFSAKPPSGPTTVEVKVGPVPGEKLTDNNEATYPVVFQR